MATTPVFLPGESQGRRSLVGCRLWGRTESDMTEVTQQQQQQTIACQAPMSKGSPRQEYWSGLPFSPPGDLPDPGIQPMFPEYLILTSGFFSTVPLGKLSTHKYQCLNGNLWDLDPQYFAIGSSSLKVNSPLAAPQTGTLDWERGAWKWVWSS